VPGPQPFRLGFNPKAPGYVKAARIHRWLALFPCTCFAAFGGLILVWREGAEIPAGAAILVSAIAAFAAVELSWRRIRFCDVCGARVLDPSSGEQLAWCAGCGTLSDRAAVAPKQPGVFDTSAYFNHDDPYVRYFNLIIMLAVKDHGSELRLEPAEDSYEMRLLVDDQYYEMVPAPADIHGFISQAVKVIAGFDMSESARQEGEIDIRTKIESVRTTVSLEPTEYGDTIVLQFGKKIGR